MKKLRMTAGIAAILGMTACGGGGSDGDTGSDSVERPAVVAKLTALNSEGEAGDGSDGSGGEAGGGIGAGGSLGALQDVTFKVTGANDLLIGETDVPTGSAVTIYPPLDYTGPLNIEILGKPSSSYYDEHLERNAPTGSGVILRAVVGSANKRIGVTPLTTAAARYYDLQTVSIRTKALNATDIEAANKRMADQINRFLPSDRQVTDITLLPVLTNSTTTLFDKGSTEQGKYAQVLAAFAIAAKKFNSSLPEPALAFSKNLERDMTDGTIDNRDSDGNAIAPAGELAYDVDRLQSDLAGALDEVRRPAVGATGQIPSAAVCINPYRDETGDVFPLVGIRHPSAISSFCDYDLNGLTGPLAFVQYINELDAGSNLDQCGAGGEFVVVPLAGGFEIRSSRRLVSAIVLADQRTPGIAMLQRAVAEGVGAKCP